MSNSIYWLSLSATMAALLWLPYVLDRLFVRGLMGVVGNPTPADEANPKASAWAWRARRAHANSVENLAVFATLVLAAQAVGAGNVSMVVLAAQVYFWARLAHFIVYSAGIPVARTLAFTAGFVAQMMVAFVVLSKAA